MKKWILAAGLMGSVPAAQAQSFEEWFRQKETQINYLREQVAALQAYGDVVNKGYEILHTGWADIFGSRDGDFTQHLHYFLSLWKVNPGISRYSKLSSIVELADAIAKQSAAAGSLPLSDENEKSYVRSVFSNLVLGCKGLLDQLGALAGDGRLQMKDDERIQRMDRICLEIQDRYEFSSFFLNSIRTLVSSRAKETSEIKKSYLLHEIK